MEKKYENVYKIKIDDVISFISNSTVKKLKENGINNLGELFEFFDNTNNIKFYTDKARNISVYRFLCGSVKLLKYHYLKIDPEFTGKEDLCDLGISSKTYYLLRRFCAEEFNFLYGFHDLNGKEIIEKFNLTDISVLHKFYGFTGVGRETVEELRTKSELISKYFESKNNCVIPNLIEEGTSDNQDLISLYIELRELLKRSRLLNEQIEKVQSKIQEKIDVMDEKIKL